MKPVAVRGLGLWTPGFASPGSWCRNQADPSVRKPAALLLSGPLRRRAPPLTRMGVEVLAQAAAQAGCDPSEVVTVWVTCHGEHSIAISLLDMMHRGEGKLSPTRFHNSVHNTAGGYASIATGNTLPSTTLSGGREMVASGLLEAWCLLEVSGRDVVLVMVDEPLQPPFEQSGAGAPLALGLCLSARQEGALGVLSGLRRAATAPAEPVEPFGGLYVSAGLPLLERIVRRDSGTVALELGTAPAAQVWCVEFEAARA